jgi:CO dehydrogenase/acetyl-CoA synthase gamma subunit (corrinoid Fe-S protein)
VLKPCYETPEQPKVIEILRMLPKTNCKECGLPTCTVFAVQTVEGVKGAEDCPPMSEENREKMRSYLKSFSLNI